MKKDEVLIISNHHRRAMYFEETMHRLDKAGYHNIWIQDTGGPNPWGGYQGPRQQLWDVGHRSYDQGMSLFKQRQVPKEIKVIALIDNDCFISNPDTFTEYLRQFKEDKYDWACHLILEQHYINHGLTYEEGQQIVPVTSQTFTPNDTYPGFCPDPHWENAYLLINRDLWDQQTPQDVSHGRIWIKRTQEMGAKMGAHKAEYRLGYTHFGDGWFHVGNLMAYYYAFEKENMAKFSPDSELDMSRLGYFLRECGPDKECLLKLCGVDVEKAKEAWRNLIKDTCMEDFK